MRRPGRNGWRANAYFIPHDSRRPARRDPPRNTRLQPLPTPVSQKSDRARHRRHGSRLLERHSPALPNLDRLRREGDFKRLGTTIPPQAPWRGLPSSRVWIRAATASSTSSIATPPPWRRSLPWVKRWNPGTRSRSAPTHCRSLPEKCSPSAREKHSGNFSPSAEFPPPFCACPPTFLPSTANAKRFRAWVRPICAAPTAPLPSIPMTRRRRVEKWRAARSSGSMRPEQTWFCRWKDPPTRCARTGAPPPWSWSCTWTARKRRRASISTAAL